LALNRAAAGTSSAGGCVRNAISATFSITAKFNIGIFSEPCLSLCSQVRRRFGNIKINFVLLSTCTNFAPHFKQTFILYNG
ncbi:MAG: hypothetical protein J1F13_06965, partial [Prevotellaceae bacterium]|nr:hypothetical protein [Prevotellaceae bacterium]